LKQVITNNGVPQRMSDLFDSELRTLLRSARRGRAKPDDLYHYTSADGLLGIIDRRALRGSNIWYLNDRREFSLALDLCRIIIEERSDTMQERFERGLLIALGEALENSGDTDVFVGSFAEDGDQLSQWRGYCPKGGGYSVGFVLARLEQIVKQDRRFVLAPVVYAREAQLVIMNRLVDSAITYGNGLWENSHGDLKRVYSAVYQEFASLIAVVSPLIKDSSFHEEAEWRLVSLPRAIDKSEWHFRSRGTMVVPFIEIPLPVSDGVLELDALVIGPAKDIELAVSAAKAMDIRGLVKIGEVNASTIPYRDW
jgi:Protein of unknown function (DUF2971)